MRLPDGTRHVVAGIGAAGAFLGLFFGATLVWWLALALGVGVYFALLLVIQRRPFDEEVMLATRTSQADIKQAVAALQAAAERLRAVAGAAHGTDAETFGEMADHVQAIQGHIARDPRDYRATRAFIVHHLPTIVKSAEDYVALEARASGENRARIARLGDQIRSFAPVIARIDQACLENDFQALEVELDVLGGQLGAGRVAR